MCLSTTVLSCAPVTPHDKATEHNYIVLILSLSQGTIYHSPDRLPGSEFRSTRSRIGEPRDLLGSRFIRERIDPESRERREPPRHTTPCSYILPHLSRRAAANTLYSCYGRMLERPVRQPGSSRPMGRLTSTHPDAGPATTLVMLRAVGCSVLRGQTALGRRDRQRARARARDKPRNDSRFPPPSIHNHAVGRAAPQGARQPPTGEPVQEVPLVLCCWPSACGHTRCASAPEGGGGCPCDGQPCRPRHGAACDNENR